MKKDRRVNRQNLDTKMNSNRGTFEVAISQGILSTMPTKKENRHIDEIKKEIAGLLLVDKPRGKSSFFLVSLLRKILNVKKIGHAGTLDPLATGVMVMLIGKQYTTRSNEFLCDDKEYLAEIRLGITTDSYDADGVILATSDRIPVAKELEEAITHFQGEIEQIPPMFSAKKIKGERLYYLARKGKQVERPPSHVRVQLTLLSYNYPYVVARIACSKGTYIRSIAHDLGVLLHTGAHLTQLQRTRSGNFTLEECLNIDHLTAEIVFQNLKKC